VFFRVLIFVNRSETDGRLTEAQLRQVAGVAEPDKYMELLLAHKLIARGKQERSLLVRNWRDYGKSREEMNDMRAKRRAAGSTGGQASGLARTAKQAKQTPKQTSSKLLGEPLPVAYDMYEANGQAKVNPLPLPLPLPPEVLDTSVVDLNGSREAAPNGEVFGTQSGGDKLTQRLAGICTSTDGVAKLVESHALIAWASTKLSLEQIDEVIGVVEATWDPRPVKPRAIASLMQGRAEQYGIHLEDFEPAPRVLRKVRSA